MIKVQQKDFNYALEVSALSKGNHNIGGVCAFTGLVRDMLGDKQINNLNLEHYPGMTEKCSPKMASGENLDHTPLRSTESG